MGTPMSPTCTLLGMPPRAMTAQFSNSNGGMTRSFSTVHGRSRTTKPRPTRQSIRFPAGANVAQAFGHDAQAWAKYQGQSHAREFSRGRRTILQLRGVTVHLTHGLTNDVNPLNVARIIPRLIKAAKCDKGII